MLDFLLVKELKHLNYFYAGDCILTLTCSQSSYYYLFAMCNIPFIADMSCRSRLATLNEKLTTLERRVEYIEARVSLSEKSLNFVPD